MMMKRRQPPPTVSIPNKRPKEEDAYQNQEDDDDDLPSVTSVFENVKKSTGPSSAPSTPNSLQEFRRKSRDPPPALHLGMPVLAKFCGNRSQFHPARVLEFSDTHATLRFWDDAKIHVNRWSLLTLECPQIAHVDIAAEVYQATAVSESFVSEELTTGLRAIHSALVSLMQDDPSTTDSVVGSDSKKKKRKAEKGEAENKESSRRQDFFAGGKRRQRLAQRIGRGPFTKNEYYFILRRLHQLFPFKRPAAQVESSDTTIKPTTKTINTTLFTNESEYRQFIGSVLWPEAIIRLIQWRHANQHADEPPLTLMECEERMMRGTHLPTDTNNVNSDEDNLVEETELKWLDEFLSLIEMYQTAARGAHR